VVAAAKFRSGVSRLAGPFGWLTLLIALVCATFGVALAQPPDTGLSPPADVARFAGRPVVGVEVLLDDATWPDVRAPVLSSVKAAEPFSAAVARRALAEVMASGSFARGRVAVMGDGAGVRIVVHVVARKIVETLSIDTHGAGVEKDEIAREADLAEGGEILGATMPEQRAKIAALFVRHGYPRPEVTITTRATEDRQRVIVLIDVQPGVPRLLAKRVFYITDVEAKNLEQIAASEYAVGRSERADDANLGAADTKLETSLRARGYHHADVSHDVILWNGQVTLRVRVETGPLFQARFEGNERYDQSALSGALDLENEPDRSPAHLVQKLKDFYAKRGYLDAEVTAEQRGGDADRVHQLVFKIFEHRRVLVGTRSYPCLKEEDVKKLSEGGPRSAAAIGNEIDSYLEDELPGADLVKDPDPRGLDKTIGPAAGDLTTGARTVPVDLDPDTTFVPDTYERALAHVQELYRNEGFLHAQVGPAQVMRRRCSAKSPAGQCIPEASRAVPSDVCTYDASNLPLPVAPLEQELRCVPDPLHGVECEPRIALRIPVKLGPRTTLYDVAFTGERAFSEQQLADAAKAGLGDPVNTLRLDDARRRILDLYKEEGYAFVDVRYTLEPSVDNTRARVRFEIIEGVQVLVRDIVVVGNRLTHTAIVRGRSALAIGQPYRASDIRKTQERVATLNVFTSVSVDLAEPYVPQKYKTVIITVNERLPQAIEQQGGFTTGEGIYYGFEYAHRNIFGDAIAFTLRGRLSYLPTLLILDPQVRQNFTSLGDPGFDQRIAARVTASIAFPEIGLGPLVRTQLDAVFVHDLQRDFYITKIAVVPSLQYRPIRPLLFTLSQSVEDNYVKLFQFDSTNAYLASLAQQPQNGGRVPPDIAKYLLIPDGASFALAQRFVVGWDRRDNSFNASRGTYFVSGLEHVDSFPVYKKADNVTTFEGHFLRFTETFAGYIPLPRGMRIAAELRLGTNVQLTPTSQTYPDRLFFMGGVESMRGWALSSFLPQDDLDQIAADFGKPDCVNGTQPAVCGAAGATPNLQKFTAASQPVRGGNMMVNPRLELRVPVTGPLETAIFTDVGNLWRRASYPLDTGRFPMRASVGAGVRLQTPVGPVAVDYGINVTRHAVYANEDFGALHFAIGLF
jgi:outer membrane protein insertion porin family